MWPPPPPRIDSATVKQAPVGSSPVVSSKLETTPNYFNVTLKNSLVYTVGLGSALGMSYRLSWLDFKSFDVRFCPIMFVRLIASL